MYNTLKNSIMENKLQDQNLGDAPDEENKVFNPSNTLSEPADKGPVGPTGTPREGMNDASKPTDENPVGQANKPREDNNEEKKA
jgi:hypothetical protein